MSKAATKYDQYQNPCLQQIRKTRKNGIKQALVVMAGGLGKTVVAARDVKDYLQTQRRRILVLCHDKEILSQNQQKFQQIVGDQYSYGFFNGVQKDFEDVDILFATFQTMGGMRGWKDCFYKDEFSYIIVDESHHSRAKTYEEVLTYFEPEFLLGLTATPDREDGRSLVDIFGEPIFVLDFVNAWAYGFLTPVDYNLVTTEIKDVKNLLGPNRNLTLKALNEQLFLRMSDEDLVKDIQKRISDLQNPRTIIFCQNIAQTDSIAELYPGAKPLHYKIPDDQRTQIMQDFRKGTLRTIVVRDMLNEGIDVPEVDVIIRLRLSDSKLLFEQQLARGLRICEGKTAVRVYDYASSLEQLDRLFDYEARMLRAERKRQQEQNQNADDMLPKDGISPTTDNESRKLIITLTGGTASVTKVDIQKLIAQGKTNAAKYIYGYDGERLLQSLTNSVKRLGYMPYQSEIIENATGEFAAVGSYLKYLGPTWEDVVNKVKEAAGEDAQYIKWHLRKHAPQAYDANLPIQTKQIIIIQIICGFVEKHNCLPTIKEFCDQPGAPSRGAFRKNGVFPTYKAAITAAGFDPNDYSLRKMTVFTDSEKDQLLCKIAAEFKTRGRPLIWEEIDKCPRLPNAKTIQKRLGINTDDWETKFIPLMKGFMSGNDEGVYWNREDLWRIKQREVFLNIMLELQHVPSRREIGNRFGSQDGIRHLSEYGNYSDFVDYMRPEIIKLAEQGKIKKAHVGKKAGLSLC